MLERRWQEINIHILMVQGAEDSSRVDWPLKRKKSPPKIEVDSYVYMY
jgi:hypothetical protein